jgi:excisionase family DNA binding protein
VAKTPKKPNKNDTFSRGSANKVQRGTTGNMSDFSDWGNGQRAGRYLLKAEDGLPLSEEELAQVVAWVEKRQRLQRGTWVSPQEAARLFNVHPRTIRRLASAGKIPALRIGANWRVCVSEMLENV